MNRSRWLSLALAPALAVGLQLHAGSAVAKTDVCAILKKHAPKDMGLALDKAVSATPEFCQAWSAGNKDSLLLRVSPMGKIAAQAVSGTRQSAGNGGKDTRDESGLGAGAWSQANARSMEITFAVKEQFVTVMLVRDSGWGAADADKARAFAKAVAGELR
jgi:hypothetical protein